MEQSAPELIKRLRTLEASLRSELRPGSVSLHLKPVRYLDTPAGFGAHAFHRYRVQIQTLIESSTDDAMQAITVEITAAGNPELAVDEITPQAGFSTVGVKRSASAQTGRQQATSEKSSAGVEIAAGGAKATSGAESTVTEQVSSALTIGGEETHARVEQYLFARKIGNRAIWRTLAGVGPVDAAGSEYTADLLVPHGVREIEVRVEARAEWFRVGVVPAELRRRVILPHPDEEPRTSAE